MQMRELKHTQRIDTVHFLLMLKTVKTLQNLKKKNATQYFRKRVFNVNLYCFTPTAYLIRSNEKIFVSIDFLVILSR